MPSAGACCLAWLDYFADEERFGLDSMIELYAGERSGDVLARVRGLGTLALLLKMVGAWRMARRRTNEAYTIAHRGSDPAAIAAATFGLALDWQESVEASGHDSVRVLHDAAAAFHAIGDLRGWAGATTLIYWLHYRKGDLASLAALAAEMMRIGRGAGDPHIITWAQDGLGCTRSPRARLTRPPITCPPSSSWRDASRRFGCKPVPEASLDGSG